MYERVDIDLAEDGYLPDPSTSQWFKDLQEHLDARPWWKVHIYLPIIWFWQKYSPMVYARKIKHFIQRGRKGYAERDLWSFGTYSMEVLRDGILDSMPLQYSYPAEYAQDDWGDGGGPEYWEAIQSTIVYGLDHIVHVMKWDETCTCCGKYCQYMDCPIVQDTFEFLIPNWLSLGD